MSNTNKNSEEIIQETMDALFEELAEAELRREQKEMEKQTKEEDFAAVLEEAFAEEDLEESLDKTRVIEKIKEPVVLEEELEEGSHE